MNDRFRKLNKIVLLYVLYYVVWGMVQEIWGILQLALTRTGDDLAHAHSKLAGASFKLSDFAMSSNPRRTRLQRRSSMADGLAKGGTGVIQQ